MLHIRIFSLFCMVNLALPIFTDGFNVPNQLQQSRSTMRMIGFTCSPKYDSNDYSYALNMMQDSDSKDDSLSSPFDKPVLAFLDFISIFIFAAIGKASHSSDGSLDFSSVLSTAFPFLLAWYTTSPLTKVYSEKVEYGPVESGKLAATGWLFAIPLGICIRGILKGYVPPLPFVIITMITTLILISGPRIVYSLVTRKEQE